MSYPRLLTALGLVSMLLGCVKGGWWFAALWPGANFLALGLAHWRGAHRLFGKRADGTLPWWAWTCFLPLLLCSLAVWALLSRLSPEPAFHPITDRLTVGRRLLASELDGAFDNYVDLTAEFSEPRALRQSPSYRSFPILDGAAPAPEALFTAVTSLRPGRTFVHCAQGHGRAALFALAMLLTSGAARTVDDGLKLLTAVRPGVRLNRTQRECIDDYRALLQAKGGSGAR